MADHVPKRLFAALERAEPLLIEALQSAGVSRVEYAVGFVHPYRITVWLGTTTDAQRDELPRDQPCLDLVLSILDSAGLPSEEVGEMSTTAQSQETVDRAYEGSWFYALR